MIKLKQHNLVLYNKITELIFKMLSNLSLLQQNNIFSETPGHYNLIVKQIKTEFIKIQQIPKNMMLKDNMELINSQLKEINHNINLNLNYIAPSTFNDVMIALTNDNNFSNYYDKQQIDFLNKMFGSIMVWHSVLHKKEFKLLDNDTLKTDDNIHNNTTDNIQNNNHTMKLDTNSLNSHKQNNSSNLLRVIIEENSNLSDIANLIKKFNSKKINNKNKYRKNHWRKIDIISKVSDINKICFEINPLSNSLFEELNGIIIYLKYYDNYIALQGYIKDDILAFMRDHSFIKPIFEKITEHINNNEVNITKQFKTNFINIISLKDILTVTPEIILNNLRYYYKILNTCITKPLLILMNDFLLSPNKRKIDILISLLLANNDYTKLAAILYDTLKQQAKTDICDLIYKGLPISLRNELDTQIIIQQQVEEKLNKITDNEIPYEKKISLLNVDDSVKSKAVDKLTAIKNNMQGDSKAVSWLDGLLKIPFGVFKENPILTFKSKFYKNIYDKYNITIKNESDIVKVLNDDNVMLAEWNNFKNESKQYISSARNILDQTVYGHNEAKTQIERVIGQWINGEVKGAVLGLQGPPGTGKTSLAIKGLSKCLTDTDGTPRPFAFLPVGGSTDGSTFVGHNYAYVGATWGRIVDILMTCKCMNPIIFIDEIDKVSRTERGNEIISILTHLTDPTQNHEFEDKYFRGIKFDLSKALFVLSFNDVNLIDPILKDRITVIETHPLTLPEKINISTKFIIPEILKEIGFSSDEVVFSEDIITYLIDTYTYEAGVRKLKEKYYEILRDINLQKIYQNSKLTFPFVITHEYINKLFHKKPKIKIKQIHQTPKCGVVNGLYATTMGIGGLTVIQVIKHSSNKNLEISMTGKQGDVMKESIDYAFKIAFGLLPFEKQKEIINQTDKFGLHVHTPEAATPKDGPSAGAAITLAFYSILTGEKINNKVAMTGEIDLLQNVTAIGGLGPKLLGAKKSGVTKVLIPYENIQDLEILRKEGTSPEDSNFKVIPVSHFSEILKEALITE